LDAGGTFVGQGEWALPRWFWKGWDRR
jgi:hypothetical protein